MWVPEREGLRFQEISGLVTEAGNVSDFFAREGAAQPETTHIRLGCCWRGPAGQELADDSPVPTSSS